MELAPVDWSCWIGIIADPLDEIDEADESNTITESSIPQRVG